VFRCSHARDSGCRIPVERSREEFSGTSSQRAYAVAHGNGNGRPSSSFLSSLFLSLLSVRDTLRRTTRDFTSSSGGLLRLACHFVYFQCQARDTTARDEVSRSLPWKLLC